MSKTIYTLHHSGLMSSCFGFTSTLQMCIHYFPNFTYFSSPLRYLPQLFIINRVILGHHDQ